MGLLNCQVMVTMEKIAWLCAEGEQWLAPEKRSAGVMMFYKARTPLCCGPFHRPAAPEPRPS